MKLINKMLRGNPIRNMGSVGNAMAHLQNIEDAKKLELFYYLKYLQFGEDPLGLEYFKL